MIHKERISELSDAMTMVHRITAAFNEIDKDQRVFWEWLTNLPNNCLIKDLSLCEAAELAEKAAGAVYVEDLIKEAEETTVF